jgi:hypothetical protein
MSNEEKCYKCGNNHNLGSANWTLAGKLCANRADRPNEWTMDDFIREALKQEQEIKRLREALEEIKDMLYPFDSQFDKAILKALEN